VESNVQPEEKQTSPDATGFAIAPMVAAAAFDSVVFSMVNASESAPATWEERPQGLGILRRRAVGEKLRQLLAYLYRGR
jgi:hypothetical protein